MSEVELIPLISRWVHILSVIIALGGSIFMRLIVMPAAASALAPDQHERLREGIAKRWRGIVHGLVALLLLSGLYNYLAVTRFEHGDQPIYHMLFGIKFLLALGVFFLAETLVSKRDWSAGLRSKAKTWLLVLVTLGITIVLISGILKMLPAKPELQDDDSITQVEVEM